jgi:hypothetical protein
MAPFRARRVAITLLVAVLAFGSVSRASAGEWRSPRVAAPGLWEDLRKVVLSLLGLMAKSGSSLDPDGNTTPGSGGGTTQAPAGGDAGESGSSLDPDGRS